jgi:hypothetical protein
MAPSRWVLATAIPQAAAVISWQTGLIALTALFVTYAFQLLMEARRHRFLLTLTHQMRLDMAIYQEQHQDGGHSLRITRGSGRSSGEPDGR